MNKVFEISFDVQVSEIDSLKHVNNEVYLSWAIRAASEHSKFLGYGMDEFLKRQTAFVVRRHEIDYLAPAFLGDTILVRTWISLIKGARSNRHYEILNKQTGKVLAKASTLWVFIDLKTGKPREIFEDMIENYSHYLQ